MAQELGETRDAMTRDFLGKVLPQAAEEVYADTKWNQFYLLFSYKEDLVHYNVVRCGKIATKQKPCVMPLNSMCFHIDYPAGSIDPEWILPRDFGFDTSHGSHEQVSELAYASNQKYWTGK